MSTDGRKNLKGQSSNLRSNLEAVRTASACHSRASVTIWPISPSLHSTGECEGFFQHSWEKTHCNKCLMRTAWVGSVPQHCNQREEGERNGGKLCPSWNNAFKRKNSQRHLYFKIRSAHDPQPLFKLEVSAIMTYCLRGSQPAYQFNLNKHSHLHWFGSWFLNKSS